MRRLLDRWLTVYAIIFIAFLYLPVIFLPIFSINTSAVPQFPALRLYAQMVRRTAAHAGPA